MSKKIVLFGAGSAQFGLGSLGEIFTSKVLETSEIYLVDINPHALEKVRKIASSFVDEKKLRFKISAGTDRKEALEGADFVIISIEVGNRFALWDQDRTLPQEYGIRQIYGENGGPGGLFHALRITPPILEICADVHQICPQAYVFCYSNPMSRICSTVHRKYPDLNFIGLCHEIASLERYLPDMLQTPFENLSLRAGGLNHFSVLLSAQYKDTGKDAYADIREKAPSYFARQPGYSDLLDYAKKTGEPGYTEGTAEGFEKNVHKYSKEWADRCLFKVILEEFGYLPITGDSHFGEYISWAYDTADLKGIIDFYEWYKVALSLGKPVIKTTRHERFIYIIEGLLGKESYEEVALNIPNHRYIDQLPDWIAVEVPATISAAGIQGLALGKLPKGIAGLLTNNIAVHDLTAEAILTGSKKAVVQALLVDPIVDRHRGMKELVEVMCSLQSDYLSYLH